MRVNVMIETDEQDRDDPEDPPGEIADHGISR